MFAFPYTEEIEQTYTVQVPMQETVSAERTVTKCVPVTTMRTVTRDRGSYECQAVQVACGGCNRGCRNGCNDACGGTKTVYKRVHVPNLVTEEVPCTTYERQTTKVPYTYTVTRCKTETRTRKVPVTRCKTETRTRKVSVTKCRPEQRTRMVQVQKCRAEERTRDCVVTKYQTEQRTREVPVCKTRLEERTL